MKKGVELSLKNVSLNLGGNQILRNINLDIKSGEIHCIIGPNGGGKSSLIKCLLSLMPFEGEIKMSYDEEKVIGYVPQNLDFDKTLPITVEDFLTMIFQDRPSFLGPNSETKEKIDSVLRKIDMIHKKKRMLGSLSGGELQRVLLAQSLYPEPNLLILDEPFSGIDTVCETYFLEMIKKLKDEGVTIIWIHHNLKQVIEVADKVTCIKGTVIFSGVPKEEIVEERIFDIFS
ncbi:metal ABC transporter ATP-binding protein [Streptobacillus felis]|uniref:Metal ABC transporter ATP-binding protein n=1 Tax=Streptobacillus felis TaxID=1384509 RepID=A0A7Z0PEE3_9FUSO|nr:metal ABC transporter ATP-binding protein [Streptobacillus felis]NYV27729.1 metal ABC transporter ATP-binding protein [Streptobacillus felis]